MVLPDQLNVTGFKLDLPCPRLKPAQHVLGQDFDILDRPLLLRCYRLSIEDSRCRRSCPDGVPLFKRNRELLSPFVVYFGIAIADYDILAL